MKAKGQEQGWVGVILGEKVRKKAGRSVIAQSGQTKKFVARNISFRCDRAIPTDSQRINTRWLQKRCFSWICWVFSTSGGRKLSNKAMCTLQHDFQVCFMEHFL